MALIITRALVAGALIALASGAQGQIKIGVTISATGPAASLGIAHPRGIPAPPRVVQGPFSRAGPGPGKRVTFGLQPASFVSEPRLIPDR